MSVKETFLELIFWIESCLDSSAVKSALEESCLGPISILRVFEQHVGVAETYSRVRITKQRRSWNCDLVHFTIFDHFVFNVEFKLFEVNTRLNFIKLDYILQTKTASRFVFY